MDSCRHNLAAVIDSNVSWTKSDALNPLNFSSVNLYTILGKYNQFSIDTVFRLGLVYQSQLHVSHAFAGWKACFSSEDCLSDVLKVRAVSAWIVQLSTCPVSSRQIPSRAVWLWSGSHETWCATLLW